MKDHLHCFFIEHYLCCKYDNLFRKQQTNDSHFILVSYLELIKLQSFYKAKVPVNSKKKMAINRLGQDLYQSYIK